MNSQEKEQLVEILASIGAICIVTLVVMLLWNWIIPDITGFKSISFWQAFVLRILATWITDGSLGRKRSE